MEIELYSKINNPIEGIRQVGEFFAKSGMFGCEKIEQGMVLAMACLAEKKSPLEIKRTYHLLNGELSMRADAMLAQFRSKGGKHKVLKRTADEASVELELNGDKQTFTFTWEMAKAEPFVWMKDKDKGGNPIPKKNWATPRARMQMLWARVISDGVRTLAPEIVSGVYTPEEAEDETPQPAPKPLFTPTGAAKPAVDVASTPVTTAPPAASTSPAPEPVKPAAPILQFASMDPETKRLTPESVGLLEKAIGEENATTVLEWMKKQGWIKTNLSELSAKKANAILTRTEAFLAEVKRSNGEQKAA